MFQTHHLKLRQWEHSPKTLDRHFSCQDAGCQGTDLGSKSIRIASDKAKLLDG